MSMRFSSPFAFREFCLESISKSVPVRPHPIALHDPWLVAFISSINMSSTAGSGTPWSGHALKLN